MDDPNTNIPRTPGVSVTDKSLFPPSIGGVETAVPAFIGYTERADIGGEPATNLPVRIASLTEYGRYFGRANFEVRRAGRPQAPRWSCR